MWNSLNQFNDQTTLLDKIFQHESNLVSKNKTIKNIKTLIVEKFKDFDLILKGGLDYGKNKNDIKEPHFYIKINDGELRVLIPKLEDFRKKEYILSAENYDIFKGLDHIHNELVQYFRNTSNLKFIQEQWNELNIHNNNVSKIQIPN